VGFKVFAEKKNTLAPDLIENRVENNAVCSSLTHDSDKGLNLKLLLHITTGKYAFSVRPPFAVG
jgi:hypothetical protein